MKIRKRKKQHPFFLIGIMTILILLGMGYKTYAVSQEVTRLKEQKEEQELLLEQERKRFDEICNQQEYQKTRAFKEEVAHNILNLYYPNEIIFETN